MSVQIKKLTNVSENAISVILKGGNSIYLPPKGILEDVELADITGIAKWVKVEYYLPEVNPTPNNRTQIFG